MAKYLEEARIIFTADSAKLNRAVKRMRGRMRKESASMAKDFRKAFIVGLGGGIGLKVFADFEQGLAGVSKTTGIAGEGLERFGKQIRKLSKDSIYGTSELLEIAKAAGQLGISGSKDLLAYTDTVAKLGSASNLAGEEAAFALARISTLTKLPHSSVENLASAIVDLGNNFEATESQIAETAQSIAAAISSYGVSADQVVSLGAAVAAVGQDGAKSATAIGKVFGLMNKAVLKGGAGLEAFANTMGMTGEQVRLTFKENSTKAFEEFITGLSKSGDQMDLLLESVGLMDFRTNRVLKALATDADGLSDALERGKTAFAENRALQKEYEVATDTLLARSIKLWRKLEDVALVLGTKLAPAAEKVVRTMNKFLNSENIQMAGKWVYWILRLSGAFLAARIAISAARWAVFALTIALGGLRTAAGLAMGALTLGLSVVVAFMPEIISFFSRRGPAMIKSFGLVARSVMEGWRAQWLSLKVAALEALLRISTATQSLAQSIGEFVGWKPEFGFITSLQNQLDQAQASLIEARSEMRKLGEEAVRVWNHQPAGLSTAAYSQRGVIVKGSGTGSGDDTEGAGVDDADGEGAGAGASATDAERAAWVHDLETQRKLLAMHHEGIEQAQIAHYERMRGFERERILLADETEQARRAATEARIEFDQTREEAAWKEEQAAMAERKLKKEEEDARLAEEMQWKLETEQELRRMMHEGALEDELNFYERMRELKLTEWQLQDEENALRRQAELEANRRQQEALIKSKEASEKRQKNIQLKQREEAFKGFLGQFKQYGEVQAKLAKFQAIRQLLTTMPGFASQAFGQAMATLPPPLGQIVGAISFAAVMAKSALGLQSAKQAEVPGMMTGGMVGGGFSLGDDQLRALNSREVVVPAKSYSDIEAGIKQKLMSGGMDQPIQEPVEVNISLVGEAGSLMNASLTKRERLAL